MEIWLAQAATVAGRGTHLTPTMLSGSPDGALAILAQSGLGGVIRSWLHTEQIPVFGF